MEHQGMEQQGMEQQGMEQQGMAIDMDTNPLFGHSDDVFGFYAEKCGKRNPISRKLFHRRFFVCETSKRHISYWKSAEDADKNDVRLRRGSILVKEAYFRPRKNRCGSSSGSESSSRSGSESSSGSDCSDHKSESDSDSCSSISDDDDDDEHCSTQEDIEVVDAGGRVYHLRGLQSGDALKVLRLFSPAPNQHSHLEKPGGHIRIRSVLQSIVGRFSDSHSQKFVGDGDEKDNALYERTRMKGWHWDVTSKLVVSSASNVYALTGANQVATKVRGDLCSQNTLAVSPPMRPKNSFRKRQTSAAVRVRNRNRMNSTNSTNSTNGTNSTNSTNSDVDTDNVHTISFRMTNTSDPDKQFIAFCGVVRDGAACSQRHLDEMCTQGWFMGNYKGGLCGNGFRDAFPCGQIMGGQILTMRLDMERGSLEFWVDGKRHGPGYAAGVVGPLRWATTVYRTGIAVEIVPTPELELELEVQE